MAGTRRDRYFYAGMAFILGILSFVIGLGAYLLGEALVGESILVAEVGEQRDDRTVPAAQSATRVLNFH